MIAPGTPSTSDGGAATDASADGPPEAGLFDLGPPPALQAVSGDLTFALRGDPLRADSAHLYSVVADGRLQQRLTATAADWRAHAVGPDPRFVAATRVLADGRGEVVVLDVRTHAERVISPVGCDAGRGGVGWRDQVQVMFTLSCDNEDAQIFVGSRDELERRREALLQITDGADPVGGLFPAASTTVHAYTLLVDDCVRGDCVKRSEIWIGDSDSGDRCRVTDGAPHMRDVSTVTEAEKVLGDLDPALSADLTSVTFSRTVAGRGDGPRGHLDAFREGIDLASLYQGSPTCGAGSVINLSDELLGEPQLDAEGQAVTIDDRFPQTATAGGLLAGAVLSVAARIDLSPATAPLQVTDRTGDRLLLTDADAVVTAARWITTQFDTRGIR